MRSNINSLLIVAGIFCLPGVAGQKPQYVLVAGVDERCEKLAPAEQDPTSGVTRVNFWKGTRPLKFRLPEPLNGNRVADIDNDGEKDEVYAYQEWNTYQQGTTWYIFHDPMHSAAEVRSVSEMSVLPCQFDPAVKGAEACAPLSQDSDEAAVAVAVPGSGQEVSFRSRYTSMWPMSYRGRTYLLLTSEAAETETLAAVIEPTGGFGYRSICLFKRQT